MTDFSPLGVFEEQVLVAVLRSHEDAFGMQVRREIERLTGRDLAIGAVYATLDRLEAKGLLTSTRSRDSTARRVFAVSAVGARALAETHRRQLRLRDGLGRGRGRALEER